MFVNMPIGRDFSWLLFRHLCKLKIKTHATTQATYTLAALENTSLEISEIRLLLKSLTKD